MKKEYHGHSNKSGIYKITNQINRKIYIGSTSCFKTRASQHAWRLKSGKHCNKHLLSSFKKYGTDAFTFEVIEVVVGSTEELRIIEEQYLKEQVTLGNWKNCYNAVTHTSKKDKIYWSSTPEETKKKIGKASKLAWTIERRKKASIRSKKMWECPEYREHMRKTRTGQTRSEETKRKLSKQKLGEKNPMWGGGFSKEHREKMSKSRKGKSLGPHTEETKRKISDAHKGKKRRPCSEETKKKISLANKGKKLSQKTIERLKDIKAKTYNIVLISPNNEEYILVRNSAKFAEEHNLHRVGLNKLINKKIKYHRGWTLKH